MYGYIKKPSSDPKEIIENGGLFPLGGDENSSGYKGYGLTFMVEILCGILGGANAGP
jgi:L-2-hydroxycarboxylate dehydrogenase (NAD+)